MARDTGAQRAAVEIVAGGIRDGTESTCARS